jgi:hypothetical protein
MSHSFNYAESTQVIPLPIGPGGANPLTNKMNSTNEQLAMLTTQSKANTEFDPEPPKPITPPIVKGKTAISEAFCSMTMDSSAMMVGIAGCLLIVYGLVSK